MVLAEVTSSFTLAIWVLVLSKPSLGQEISCPGSGNQPLLFAADLNAFNNCTVITSDIVIGYENCEQSCFIENLDAFVSVRRVMGSVIVQCCNLLTDLDGFDALEEVTGTVKVHYNQRLQAISGFGMLQEVINVEISQNSDLESVTGMGSLSTVDGYVALDRNPVLSNIDGFSSVTVINGNQLFSGHSLVLLYNIALADLSGFGKVTSVSGGTVRIEGNSNLCYAGYPRWNYGSYSSRYSSGDMGIDWRSKLAAVPEWQYTWGMTGVPTLVIQDNGNQTTCASASCSSSCDAGAGCLGSDDSSLCGICYTTSSMNSCTVVDSPATTDEECSSSLPLLIALIASVGVIALSILCALGYLVWKCRERICDACKSTGSFDIVVPSDQELMNQSSDYSPNFQSSRRHRGGIIAEPSFSGPHSNQKKTAEKLDLTGTVGPVIYRKHSSLESLTNLEDTEPTHTTAAPSPEVQVVVAPTGSTISHPEIPITKDVPKGDAYIMENTSASHEEEDDDDEWEETDVIGIDSSLRIPSDRVHLKKEIGRGAFGKVFEARVDGVLSKEGTSTVVVKQLRKNASEEEMEIFLQAAVAMSSISHRNVLSLLGICLDGLPLMVVLEHCSGGNLKSFLIAHKHEAQQMRDSGLLLNMILDLANGVHYLNTVEIAHNDLAARNCVVSSSNTVKVGDYGISRTVFKEDYYTRDPNGMSWPVRWMAPEIILDRGDGILGSLEASLPSNVWSFGITLWEICSFARQPYPNMSNEEVIELLKYSGSCNLKNPISSSEPLSSLYNIMKRCWKAEKDRPRMEDMLLQLQRVKEKFKPKEANGDTLSRRPKRPAPKRPPEKKKAPPSPSHKDLAKSESTEPLMKSSKNRSPSPMDGDPHRTNPLFGSVVTSDEDDWKEAEELMEDHFEKEKSLKHFPPSTSAVDSLPPPYSTVVPGPSFTSSATSLPPPVLPPPIEDDDEDMDEDDLFLEPPDDILLPPPSDILLAPPAEPKEAPPSTGPLPPTDIIPPPMPILPSDDPLEEDDMESSEEEDSHAMGETSHVVEIGTSFVPPPPQRFSSIEDEDEDLTPPLDIPKQKYAFVEPPDMMADFVGNDDDDGWEEFDPDETQLTELSYPPYPAEGEEDIASPVLDDKEAQLIW